jgi:hypothetical protein
MTVGKRSWRKGRKKWKSYPMSQNFTFSSLVEPLVSVQACHAHNQRWRTVGVAFTGESRQGRKRPKASWLNDRRILRRACIRKKRLPNVKKCGSFWINVRQSCVKFRIVNFRNFRRFRNRKRGNLKNRLLNRRTYPPFLIFSKGGRGGVKTIWKYSENRMLATFTHASIRCFG